MINLTNLIIETCEAAVSWHEGEGDVMLIALIAVLQARQIIWDAMRSQVLGIGRCTAG